MAKSRFLDVQFPMKGVSENWGYQNQPPFTCVSATNFWPYQWVTGRGRGGSRLGMAAAKGDAGGEPYSWAPVTYVESGTVHVGVAVASSSGASVAVDDGSFVNKFGGGGVGDVTMFGNYLIYVSEGGIFYKDLSNESDTDNLSLTTDSGAPPAATTCAAHGGRLALGYNNVLYFSEVGDFKRPNIEQLIPNPLSTTEVPLPDISQDPKIYLNGSWDYSRTDRSAPWQSGGSNAQINEPIRSLIPHTHNCLLVGGVNGMQVVRGNPIALQGEIDTLSFTESPLDQGAWCKANNGITYFVGTDGLYAFPAGCPDGPPTAISRNDLPEGLAGLSAENGDKATVGYDQRWRGLHIYAYRKTGLDTGGNPVYGDEVYYFYSLVQGQEGFWPMTSGTRLRLAVNYKSAVSTTESAMLAISSSGSSFQFTKAATESFDSVLWYGPFRLGSSGTEGIVSEVASVVSDNSDEIWWGVYAADSAQEAFQLDSRPEEHFQGDATFTGETWTTTGKQYVQNPCVSGQSAYIKISANGNRRISLDKLSLLTRQLGMERVG